MAFNLFKEKYTDTESPRLTFRSDNYRKLSPDQKAFLESPFTEEDVKNTMWRSGGDKALGPDGFYFAFVKRFWEIIGSDFYAMVKYFEKASFLKNGCNDS